MSVVSASLPVLHDRAMDLRNLERGQGQRFTLVEYNYINNFLRHLVEILSRARTTKSSATWFGITRL